MTADELAYFLAMVKDYTTPMHNLPGAVFYPCIDYRPVFPRPVE
jgi:hypothetical protein